MTSKTTFSKQSPSVMFVHGMTCDSSDWDACLELAPTNWRCRTVDLPGHGSNAALEPITIEHFAQHMLAHCDGPSILVGHSMGCRVVVEAARQQPDMVAGLVLADGSQLKISPENYAASRATDITLEDHRAQIGQMFEAMLLQRLPEATQRAIVARAKNVPMKIARQIHATMVDWDWHLASAAFNAISVPTVALQSSSFTIDENGATVRVPYAENPKTDYTEALARNNKIELKAVDQAGHFLQLDQPNSVVEAIKHVISQI